MKNTVFAELYQNEFDAYYQKRFILVQGLIGLLLSEIAMNLATEGSFQWEIGEDYYKEFNKETPQAMVDYICSGGSEQYDVAEYLIKGYLERNQIKERLEYYGCLKYDPELEAYFPDWESYNRHGREFYIESEENNFGKEFLKNIYSAYQ